MFAVSRSISTQSTTAISKVVARSMSAQDFSVPDFGTKYNKAVKPDPCDIQDHVSIPPSAAVQERTDIDLNSFRAHKREIENANSLRHVCSAKIGRNNNVSLNMNAVEQRGFLPNPMAIARLARVATKLFPGDSSRRGVSQHISSSSDAAKKSSSKTASLSAGRWTYTAEIAVSKVFPAGFGWQYASTVADAIGYGADTAQFAIATGIGDMLGVVAGHSLYKAAQSLIDSRADLKTEIGTAAWLGCGSFLAGTAWQPSVNLFHETIGLGFTSTYAAVAATCGGMFFVGLRLGRAAMPWMPNANASNAAQDAGLAVSIGSATGMFVATDTSFIGPDSDLLYRGFGPLFNVAASDSAITGCIKAGSSTMTGFTIANAAQAMAMPAGKCWSDGNNPYATSQNLP